MLLSVYAPGHLDYYDSYGLIACQLVRHLSHMGNEVNAIAMGYPQVESQPSDIKTLTAKPIVPTLGGLMLGYPTFYKDYGPMAQHGPRVAITMFESTKLPDGWVESLNRMDAVITPSWFCEEVFRKNGVIAPIHVIPLGVNEVYKYSPTRPSITERPLTFLAFTDRGTRKGGTEAIHAYMMAFAGESDYRLVLKGRASKEHAKEELLRSNIFQIHDDYNETQMAQLYRSCDVLINPHKGEGFGLLPREFAATGGLALTTDWSGTADGLDLWGIRIPCSLGYAEGRSKLLAGQDLGYWAVVDPARLAEQLRHVADHWPLYQEQARAKMQAAQLLYRWDQFAHDVLGVWKEVVDGFARRTAAAA